jgi:hypothetical protein
MCFNAGPDLLMRVGVQLLLLWVSITYYLNEKKKNFPIKNPDKKKNYKTGEGDKPPSPAIQLICCFGYLLYLDV